MELWVEGGPLSAAQSPHWPVWPPVPCRLDSCGLTSKAAESLCGALAGNSTLRELYLTHNALGDKGVRLLCPALGLAACKLRVLW